MPLDYCYIFDTQNSVILLGLSFHFCYCFPSSIFLSISCQDPFPSSFQLVGSVIASSHILSPYFVCFSFESVTPHIVGVSNPWRNTKRRGVISLKCVSVCRDNPRWLTENRWRSLTFGVSNTLWEYSSSQRVFC